MLAFLVIAAICTLIILKQKKGSYIEFHLKERLGENFNLGLKAAFTNLKINHYHYDGGLGGGTGKQIEYNTYIFHPQMAFETRLIKNIMFLSFGPELAVPIYSYKKENGHNWGVETPSVNYFSSKGKNNDGNFSLRIFSALTFERSISEKMKVFINTQINYNIWSMYEGIKTLDFRIGAGVQFSLPKFNLFEKIKHGEPYILKKK